MRSQLLQVVIQGHAILLEAPIIDQTSRINVLFEQRVPGRVVDRCCHGGHWIERNEVRNVAAAHQACGTQRPQYAPFYRTDYPTHKKSQ